MFHWGVSSLMSTSQQRQKLGFFRKMLHLSEDTYYALLAEYGVTTSKNLSDKDAEKLICQLRKNIKNPTWVDNKKKYEDLRNRSKYMASPKQLRMVEAMWFDVSYKRTDSERKSALEHFAYKITGKAKLRFLTAVDIRKLVEAIKKMKEIKDEQNN